MRTWPATTPMREQPTFHTQGNAAATFTLWDALVEQTLKNRPAATGTLSRRSSAKKSPSTVEVKPHNLDAPQTPGETVKKAWALHLEIRDDGAKWVRFTNLNGLYDTPEQDPFLENLIHQYFYEHNGEYVLMYHPLETHAVTLINAGVTLDTSTQETFPHLKSRWDYLVPTAQRQYLSPGA